MTRRYWTAQETAELKQLYPSTPTAKIAVLLQRPIHCVYNKAATLRLKKSPEYLAGPEACRLRRGDNVGARFRFRPGHVPANKGVKGWQAGGRSAETQFKPGQRGNKWVPIGSERFCDGYLQRKTGDTNYPPCDWQPVHALLWVERYGPIPSGYAVKFIDGDKKNIALDNLALISRGELMLLNTIHRYPPEVKQAIRLVAKLNRTIDRVEREKQD